MGGGTLNAFTPALEGSIAIVTGGTRGVGRGIAEQFTSAGARVVTCSRQPVDSPPGELHLCCDVRDPDSVRTFMAAVIDAYGRVDVLVNNAGGSPHALAAEASARFHQRITELNLLGPLLMMQEANRHMQMQPTGGCVVNISSISATRPSPGTAMYGAAKAGLDSLTRSLAVEWAPRVRVNAIDVGPVLTEQSHLHYGDEVGVAAVAATIPLQRLATPEDVGHAAVFLSSPLASYITGATLELHGGGERPAFLGAANVNHATEESS